MRLKTDENLHPDVVEVFKSAGHDAATVWDQGMRGCADESIAAACRSEGRALLTFDHDFANILAYPPERYKGLIVLRLRRQDREYVVSVIRRFLAELETRDLDGQLLILDETGIRTHGEPRGGVPGDDLE